VSGSSPPVEVDDRARTRFDRLVRSAPLVATLLLACGAPPAVAVVPGAEPAPPASPSQPQGCVPSAKNACFWNADLSSAFWLLSGVVRDQAILVDGQGVRVDGSVTTRAPEDAYVELAVRASGGHGIAHARIDGIHWIAPRDRLHASVLAAAPAACRRRVDINLEHAPLQRLVGFLADANGLEVTGAIDGDVVMNLRGADLCPVLARAVEIAGGTLAPLPAVPRAKDPEKHPGQGCGSHHRCAPVGTLEVIGAVGEADLATAIVRRTGKEASKDRVELVRIADTIGKERLLVHRIGGAGLELEGGARVPVAAR